MKKKVEKTTEINTKADVNKTTTPPVDKKKEVKETVKETTIKTDAIETGHINIDAYSTELDVKMKELEVKEQELKYREDKATAFSELLNSKEIELTNKEHEIKAKEAELKSKEANAVTISVTPNEVLQEEEKAIIPSKVDDVLKLYKEHKALYVDNFNCVYDPSTFNEKMNKKAILYTNPYFKK